MPAVVAEKTPKGPYFRYTEKSWMKCLEVST